MPRYLAAQQFGRTMRLSLWAWILWSLPIYLLLEVGAFLIIRECLRKTASELIGPFLAFAVPWAIFAPLVWWLRKWEEQGATPKRLARGWGLSMALFSIAVMVALFYSGMELRLMDQMDAAISFVAMVPLSTPICYFVVYSRALTVISSRTSSKLGGPQLK